MSEVEVNGYEALLQQLRATEQRLREREAQLLEAHDLAGLGYWHWTVATGVVHWSKHVYRIFGLDAESFTPQIDSILALSPWPEEQQRGQELIRRLMDGPEAAPSTYEQRFLRPDGSVGWYVSTFAGDYDADGALVAIKGTVQDISERKERERRTLAILDSTPFPIAVLEEPGAEREFRFWSRTAKQLFGHTPATLAGWYELAFPDPLRREEARTRLGAALEAARETPGAAVDAGELPVSCADGSMRSCELYAAMTDGGLVLTFNDITARKAMAAQLAQADRLATMGSLAAGVAHEINNPLTYVLYNLQCLAEDVPALVGVVRALCEQIAAAPSVAADAGVAAAVAQLPLEQLDEVGSQLREAYQGGSRIQEISRALGTFSRVDRDEPAPTNVVSALEVACNMAFNEVKYRARLVKELTATPLVRANEGRLSQVFLNLIVNAAHAIDEGAAENNEISVRTWSDGDWVFAEVRDTGSGIAPEHLCRLFEPFFSTKGIGAGTGLGLSISKSIIEGYGGTIEVESAVGDGSRFCIRLPRATEQSPRARAKDDTGATLAPLSRRGRILIVDDEPAVRDVLARMLAHHEAIEAAGGLNARTLLAEDKSFDAVLCDLMMADGSGIELHRWAADVAPDLAKRFVFLTGGVFTRGVRDYLEDVDNPRLEKPPSARALQRIVAELVGD